MICVGSKTLHKRPPFRPFGYTPLSKSICKKPEPPYLQQEPPANTSPESKCNNSLEPHQTSYFQNNQDLPNCLRIRNYSCSTQAVPQRPCVSHQPPDVVSCQNSRVSCRPSSCSPIYDPRRHVCPSNQGQNACCGVDSRQSFPLNFPSLGSASNYGYSCEPCFSSACKPMCAPTRPSNSPPCYQSNPPPPPCYQSNPPPPPCRLAYTPCGQSNLPPRKLFNEPPCVASHPQTCNSICAPTRAQLNPSPCDPSCSHPCRLRCQPICGPSNPQPCGQSHGLPNPPPCGQVNKKHCEFCKSIVAPTCVALNQPYFKQVCVTRSNPSNCESSCKSVCEPCRPVPLPCKSLARIPASSKNVYDTLSKRNNSNKDVDNKCCTNHDETCYFIQPYPKVRNHSTVNEKCCAPKNGNCCGVFDEQSHQANCFPDSEYAPYNQSFVSCPKPSVTVESRTPCQQSLTNNQARFVSDTPPCKPCVNSCNVCDPVMCNTFKPSKCSEYNACGDRNSCEPKAIYSPNVPQLPCRYDGLKLPSTAQIPFKECFNRPHQSSKYTLIKNRGRSSILCLPISSCASFKNAVSTKCSHSVPNILPNINCA